MKIVIATSYTPTSIYMTNHLLRNLAIQGIIVETPPKKSFYERIEWKVRRIKKYGIKKVLNETLYAQYYDLFEKKNDLEKLPLYLSDDFKEIGSGKNIPIFEVAHINNNTSYHLLKLLNPDILVVCGTSIIKSKIFNIPKNKTINLHCGITPEYRGFGNFWALYQNKPDKVGVTVHFIDEGVDTGPIIFQERVPFDYFKDTLGTLYYKCHKEGAKLLVKAVKGIEKGNVVIMKNRNRGHFYTQFGLTEYIKFRRMVSKARSSI